MPANDYLDKYRQGRWEADLIQISLDYARTTQTPHRTINYLDICHSIHGVTPQQWLQVAQRYRHLSYDSPKLFLYLANLLNTQCDTSSPGLPTHSECREYLSSLYCHSGARMIADVLGSGYLGCRLQHYPSLLSDVDNALPVLSANSQLQGKARRQAKILASNTKPFAELINTLTRVTSRNTYEDKPCQIAIVGNSPVILQGDRGKEIDAADIVIRFNNSAVNQNKHRHIGSRTDLWVMSPSTPISYCPVDAKAIVVSGLHPLRRPSFYWKKLSLTHHLFSEFPSSVWYALVSQFQAPPSAGALLIAALEESGVVADLRCHGFTTRHGDTGNPNNHHADQTLRSGRHNWQAEACWLDQRFARLDY